MVCFFYNVAQASINTVVSCYLNATLNLWRKSDGSNVAFEGNHSFRYMTCYGV